MNILKMKYDIRVYFYVSPLFSLSRSLFTLKEQHVSIKNRIKKKLYILEKFSYLLLKK